MAIRKFEWLKDGTYVWENRRNSVYWPWKHNEPEDPSSDKVRVYSDITIHGKGRSRVWDYTDCYSYPMNTLCEFDHCKKPEL